MIYSGYAWVLLTVLPPHFGLKGSIVHVSMAQITKTVFVYLGVPFIAGVVTRTALVRARGA
ncbi:MAG: hypothetical protein ACM3RP_08540 [Chitinophagales bacterium]